VAKRTVQVTVTVDEDTVDRDSLGVDSNASLDELVTVVLDQLTESWAHAGVTVTRA